MPCHAMPCHAMPCHPIPPHPPPPRPIPCHAMPCQQRHPSHPIPSHPIPSHPSSASIGRKRIPKYTTGAPLNFRLSYFHIATHLAREMGWSGIERGGVDVVGCGGMGQGVRWGGVRGEVGWGTGCRGKRSALARAARDAHEMIYARSTRDPHEIQGGIYARSK